MFDREAVFIERVLAPLVRDLPELQGGVRAHHHRGGGRLRRRRRAERRRDDHPAAPPHQPQRDARRRHAPARLLPAGGQARAAPAGAAQGGDFGHRPSISSAPTARRTRVERQGKRPAAARASSTRPIALESYAAVFDEEGALDRFEGFASENGPRFYGLPLNEGTVTLERANLRVPRPIDAAAPPSCRSTPARRWLAACAA